MSASNIINRLRQLPADKDRFTKAEFTLTAGTSGSRTKVADVKLDRPVALDQMREMELSLVAYETFDTSGGGSQETFNLSNDLVDSGLVADSVVLYSDGTLTDPDSVDYANDSIDYTDGGSVETLTVYYTAGDQASVEVEKEAPNNNSEVVFSDDMGLIHRRDQNDDPLEFDLPLSQLQPVVPTDFRLKVYVDAPYEVAWAKDPDNSGSGDTATNGVINFPVIGAPRPVDGLGRAVRQDIAGR
jgi:hypothetical protein